MQKVVVGGTGLTRFGLFPDLSSADLARDAVHRALVDAGCEPSDVDFIAYGNVADDLVGQNSLRGEVALRPTGLLGKPIVNVENACASGSSAFHLAYAQVAAGLSEVALAVGAEKLSLPDRGAVMAAFSSGTDINDIERIRERLGGDPRGSIFMDIYADSARRLMDRHGLTAADFAQVVVKSRAAGALNENAQFRSPTTVDEVLSMRAIAGPLTLPMCSPISDGAAALVVMSAERAQRRGISAVSIDASVVMTGLDELDAPVAAARAAEAAYERAGIGPEDVHVVEVHDATASAELGLYEDLAPVRSRRGRQAAGERRHRDQRTGRGQLQRWTAVSRPPDRRHGLRPVGRAVRPAPRTRWRSSARRRLGRPGRERRWMARA